MTMTMPHTPLTLHYGFNNPEAWRMSVTKSALLRDALYDRRMDQGLTQSVISRRLRDAGIRGASQGALSQIEKGIKPFTDLAVPARLRVLLEYGFTTEEIIGLNRRHALDLEYVLPGAAPAISDQDLVRVRIVGKMGRESTSVPRRVLESRPPDSVALFDAPPATLADSRVNRALRAGAELLLDTVATPYAGMIVVHKLTHGGWAAFVMRDDDRPVLAETVDGKSAAVLKPADLAECVGVVFHAQMPADGLLGLIGPT